MTTRRALASAVPFALAFALFATLAATGAARALEVDLMTAAEAAHTPVLDVIAIACARGLGLAGLALATTLGAAALWLRGQRRDAAIVAVTMAAGFALMTALKLAFARARPEVFSWLEPADGLSFPSGHALMNATLWPLLAVIVARPWAWALAVAIPLVVAWSRVHAGVHWPTDVLAGLALGGCFVLLAGAFRADTRA